MARRERSPDLVTLSAELAATLARQRDLGARGLPADRQERLLAMLQAGGARPSPPEAAPVRARGGESTASAAAPASAALPSAAAPASAAGPTSAAAPTSAVAPASAADSTSAADTDAAPIKPWAGSRRRRSRARGAAPVPSPESAASPAAPGDEQESLAARVAACDACDRCRERTHAVCGSGATPARILFICETPDFAADQDGTIQRGPSWELFQRLVTKLGLSPSQVYLTPALKCRSAHRATRQQASACRAWLKEEWERCDPGAVVFLGGPAAAAFAGSERLRDARCGQTLSVRGRPALVVNAIETMLVDPTCRRDTWSALQKLLQTLPASRAQA